MEEKIVYHCEGGCEGKIDRPVNCGAADCSKVGEPLTAYRECGNCAVDSAADGEAHWCGNCAPVKS